MSHKLARARREYEAHGLDIADVDPDPIVQFTRWFADVEALGYFEPHAMVVATVDAAGWPAARSTRYSVARLQSLDGGPMRKLEITYCVQ